MGLQTYRALASLLAVAASMGATSMASAAQFDITGPAGSVSFGKTVQVLPNGNIVVADPDGFASGVGAVYLYRPDGSLISTLTGGNANDRIGYGGVVVLTNGNFLVISPYWSNGAMARAGAATWVDGNLGLSGVVSPANSLIGGSQDDGTSLKALALTNGNAAVHWSGWHNAGERLGAVTWCVGNVPCKGTVSAANSIVGSTANDLNSINWVALSNGNFVVGSPNWDNGSVVDAGAVTWMDGSARTLVGSLSAANSLVGTTTNDSVGSELLALNNGNYVVGSPQWDNGSAQNVGAATWADGSTAGPRRIGPVSVANSLHGGSNDYNYVGNRLTALTNGNYVVGSTSWNNNAGAATWGDGLTGRVGTVTQFNSLLGSQDGDNVGGVVVALANGNYVVASQYWDNGATLNVGAVTWGNGSSGRIGFVSAANSLIGSTANDYVGGQVVPLSNGHYAVCSPSWTNGASANAGAVTWGDGSTAGPRTVGAVSAGNSLTVAVADSTVCSGGVIALDDGNYVVGSPNWGFGAATWVDGSAAFSGTVNLLNSLRGGQSADGFGGGLVALTGGDWLALTPYYSGGGITTRGAVTRVHGADGSGAVVNTANSLVGSTASDYLGYDGASVFADGNYVVRSVYWSNGGLGAAGALSVGSRGQTLVGTVNASNSVRGGAENVGFFVYITSYDATRKRVVVGRPSEGKVTVFLLDGLFADGFEL